MEHDTEWLCMFEKERKFLLNNARYLLEVHHICSTSIPTIVAKPIIDILGVVGDVNDCTEISGYDSFGEHGIESRRYYSKTIDGVRLFNLHIFPFGHFQVKRHLNFRNLLLKNLHISAEYQELKLKLSKQFSDVNDYAKGKTDFIETMLMRL